MQYPDSSCTYVWIPDDEIGSEPCDLDASSSWNHSGTSTGQYKTARSSRTCHKIHTQCNSCGMVAP